MTRGSRPPLNALLEALMPVVRPTMLKHFTPDCCIATCRVLRKAFNVFGYDAEAVPVSVFIFNENMAGLLKDGVSIPTDRSARKELLDGTGAWSVGITRQSAEVGAPVVGGRFGGHLVLRVMNTLVDASLQQADRPERGIVLPPLLSFVPQKPIFFTQKKTRGKRCGVSVNGCEIVYERLKDYSFRKAPDWLRGGSPYTDVTSSIVSQTVNRLNYHTGGESLCLERS